MCKVFEDFEHTLTTTTYDISRVLVKSKLAQTILISVAVKTIEFNCGCESDEEKDDDDNEDC